MAGALPYTLAGLGQNGVVAVRIARGAIFHRLRLRPRLRGRSLLVRGGGLLKGADGVLERHAVGGKDVGCSARSVADYGCEYDRAVDGVAAASGGGGSGFEDASEVGGNADRVCGTGGAAMFDIGYVLRGVALERGDGDAAGSQNAFGIDILGQGQEQVLQRDFCVALGAGIVGRPPQRNAEALRHRYASELIGDLRRHSFLPASTVFISLEPDLDASNQIVWATRQIEGTTESV